jgi:hypothetical protein
MTALPFALMLIAGSYFLHTWNLRRISDVEKDVAALQRQARLSGWGQYR